MNPEETIREAAEETLQPRRPGQPGGVLPVERILQKLDSLLYQKKFEDAVRHLEYWLNEAESLGDRRGELSLLNEAVGLFRKLEREDRTFSYCEKALALAQQPEWENSITQGTTFLNVATAYKAFGHSAQALVLYERAKTIFEVETDPDLRRLGGLYNNMALALADEKEYDRARELFVQALDIMSRVEGGEPEIAVTCCNLADLVQASRGWEQGQEEIRAWLNRAMENLRQAPTRDGYYAFVCEKCAPVFHFYDMENYERELKEQIERIHERT